MTNPSDESVYFYGISTEEDDARVFAINTTNEQGGIKPKKRRGRDKNEPDTDDCDVEKQPEGDGRESASFSWAKRLLDGSSKKNKKFGQLAQESSLLPVIDEASDEKRKRQRRSASKGITPISEPDPKTPGLEGEPFEDPQPAVRDAYDNEQVIDDYDSGDDPDVILARQKTEDREAQDEVHGFFIYMAFLITVCVIVFSMTSRSAFYLTDAMTVSFMDTPFVPKVGKLAEDPVKSTTPHPTTAPSKARREDLLIEPTNPPSTTPLPKGPAAANTSSTPALLPPPSSTLNSREERSDEPRNNNSDQDDDDGQLNRAGYHMRRRRQVLESVPRRSGVRTRPEGGLAGGSNPASATKTLRSSNTVADFWEFMNTTFISMIYSDFLYVPKDPLQHTENDDRVVFYTTVLLGVARIRQLRVSSDSCTIHPQVSHMFSDCFGYYDAKTEEKNEIHPLTPVIETTTAWVYTQPEKLGATMHSGAFATYGTGGYIMDLSLNQSISETRISELKENMWIGPGTRVVIIDFTVFNSNVNLFVVCKLVVEFPPTGGIRPEGHFSTVKFFRYVSTQDVIVLGFEQVFILFVASNTVAMLRLVIRKGLQFFHNSWNVLDAIILVLSYAAIIMELYRYFVVEGMVAELVKKKEEHPTFDFPCWVQTNFDHLCAVLLFLVWVRFFKYMSFNRTINEIKKTLSRSVRGLASFSVVFVLIFLAFAQLAYLIFGSEVEEYRTVWLAAMALLQAVLGKFNYKQLEQSNFVLAPIFLMLFVFFVFFVLMNIFGAIMFESYKVVRAQIYDPREGKAGAYLSAAATKIFSFGRKRSQNENREAVSTGQKIKDSLTRAGYTKTEIDIFFAKYEIKVDSDITGQEAKKVKARLELRRFDFEPIDTSPEAVAELQEEVKRLKRRWQEQSEKIAREMKSMNAKLTSMSRPP